MGKVLDIIEDYYTREHYALRDVLDDLEEVIERLQEAQERIKYTLKEGSRQNGR